MKNKKYLKISIIAVSFCVLFEVFLYVKYDPLQSPLSREEVQKGPKALSGELVPYKTKASIVVQDKKYEIETKEGEAVFGVMNKLKEENKSFDFKYTEHTGLGIFINEINGKKGGEGGYWIYYINDKEANVGVSNYKIKNGDVISWKYEK